MKNLVLEFMTAYNHHLSQNYHNKMKVLYYKIKNRNINFSIKYILKK